MATNPKPRNDLDIRNDVECALLDIRGIAGCLGLIATSDSYADSDTLSFLGAVLRERCDDAYQAMELLRPERHKPEGGAA